MPPLADTLEDFARALRRPGGAWPGAGAAAGAGAGTARHSLDEALGIYRNNWRHNLREALAGAYPVLVQVVGAEFFRLLALRFIEEHPSTSGNLHDYGADLPAFVARFAPAQSLPYLPDLAALEWACHRAYFAEDEKPLDLQALAQRVEQTAERTAAENPSAEVLEQITFALHPACALLASDWPIDAIWHAHQPGAPADFRIDLGDGPCRVLVNRRQGEATVSPLAEDEFRWLREIRAGATLGDATACTLQQHPDFDPGTLLPRLALTGVFTRFSSDGFTLENHS